MYRSILMVLICCALMVHPIDSKGQGVEKYQALFISKFVKYLKFPTEKETLTLGIIGNSQVFIELKAILKLRKNINLKVIRLANLEEIAICDIVYLPSKETYIFAELKQAMQDNKLLLITEDPDLAKKGAGISFFVEDKKLKFTLNKDAIESNNINILPNLLSIARVI